MEKNFFCENAGGQKITYFNLKNMDKLTDINDQDLDKLGELHFKNKNNKFQVDIFDAIKNI